MQKRIFKNTEFDSKNDLTWNTSRPSGKGWCGKEEVGPFDYKKSG